MISRISRISVVMLASRLSGPGRLGRVGNMAVRYRSFLAARNRALAARLAAQPKRLDMSSSKKVVTNDISKGISQAKVVMRSRICMSATERALLGAGVKAKNPLKSAPWDKMIKGGMKHVGARAPGDALIEAGKVQSQAAKSTNTNLISKPKSAAAAIAAARAFKQPLRMPPIGHNWRDVAFVEASKERLLASKHKVHTRTLYRRTKPSARRIVMPVAFSQGTKRVAPRCATEVAIQSEAIVVASRAKAVQPSRLPPRGHTMRDVAAAEAFHNRTTFHPGHKQALLRLEHMADKVKTQKPSTLARG